MQLLGATGVGGQHVALHLWRGLSAPMRETLCRFGGIQTFMLAGAAVSTHVAELCVQAPAAEPEVRFALTLTPYGVLRHCLPPTASNKPTEPHTQSGAASAQLAT